MTTDIDRDKQRVRERVWAALETAGAAPAGVRGRIPAFSGADLAAERLAGVPVWQDVRVVKAKPDRAQLPVRVPFYILDLRKLSTRATRRATSSVAARVAETADVDGYARST